MTSSYQNIYLHAQKKCLVRVSMSSEGVGTAEIVHFFSGPQEWIVKVRVANEGSGVARDTISLSSPVTDIDAAYLVEIVYITLTWYFQHSDIRGKSVTKPGAPLEPRAVSLCFDAPFPKADQAMMRLSDAGLVEEEVSKSNPVAGGAEEGSCSVTRVAYNNVLSQLNAAYFYTDVSSRPRPPKPLRYVITGGIRHPARHFPPPDDEPFYHRHVRQGAVNSIFRLRRCSLSDTDMLHQWMNNIRVSKFWGEDGPVEHQRNFIKKNLESKHSFPVIGSWQDIGSDGFAGEVRDACYFEVYWAKEDHIALHSDSVGPWDRGIHVLVGEEWARGRVSAWLNSLVHYIFTDDPRTQCIYLEPRVDNTRFIALLQENGFYKEKEFTFPHKQAALMRLKREAWRGL